MLYEKTLFPILTKDTVDANYQLSIGNPPPLALLACAVIIFNNDLSSVVHPGIPAAYADGIPAMKRCVELLDYPDAFNYFLNGLLDKTGFLAVPTADIVDADLTTAIAENRAFIVTYVSTDKYSILPTDGIFDGENLVFPYRFNPPTPFR